MRWIHLVGFLAFGSNTVCCIKINGHQAAANTELLSQPFVSNDGGGTPWELYRGHQPPQVEPEPMRVESFVQANPQDLVAQACLPGDATGFWYYNVTNPTLTPFIVARENPAFKDLAVIIAPGGGMEFLAWQKEGTQIAKWLNTLGISAFVLKYRLVSSPPGSDSAFWSFAKPYTFQLADAQRAVSLVRGASYIFGYNVSRVGFMGFSSGASLAATVSYTQNRIYQNVDEIDSFSHIPDFVLALYGGGDPYFAPYAPPTFLAVASDDTCVMPQSVIDYYSALQRNGKHSELHVYSTGRHGFGDCSMYVETDKLEPACLWVANARLFLKSVVMQSQKPRPLMPMTQYLIRRDVKPIINFANTVPQMAR